MSLRFKVVIPARYASTRLPGKPLLDIAGKPMIAHVCERAKEADAAKHGEQNNIGMDVRFAAHELRRDHIVRDVDLGRADHRQGAVTDRGINVSGGTLLAGLHDDFAVKCRLA